MTPGREDPDELALSLDRSLERLIGGRAPGPRALAAAPDPDVDQELAHAAAVVRVALARFHPSFRFEERLAARLRATSADLGIGDGGRDTPGRVIPFMIPDPPARGRSRRVNGALIGGAISAGVSLASIAAGALVARRRGRGDARWERVS